MIFPHSTASNRRADSGVTEATGRLLPALAPPTRPASTSHAAVRCHRAHAASRLASLQALSLGSHQMARLTQRSHRFTTQTDQPGRGVPLNAGLGSLCLPIHNPWVESTGGDNFESHFMLNEARGGTFVVDEYRIFGHDMTNRDKGELWRYHGAELADLDGDGDLDLALGQIRDSHPTRINQSSIILEKRRFRSVPARSRATPAGLFGCEDFDMSGVTQPAAQRPRSTCAVGIHSSPSRSAACLRVRSRWT